MDAAVLPGPVPCADVPPPASEVGFQHGGELIRLVEPLHLVQQVEAELGERA